ncbi:hypothetical protein [Micromonospora sp. NPDC051296]|uniref:hypothetical protein n=1 Tax=Micromonospora sp. NPDC051296 TaxID=3155046 RepID=UPI003420D65F
MTLSPPRPGLALPPRANPRAALLVMLAWYCTLVVSFGVYVGSLSARVPAGCDEGCDSDRSRMLLFGLYTATPALFLALLISLSVLWLFSIRSRKRSAALIGTLSAVPALIVSGVIAAAVQSLN